MARLVAVRAQGRQEAPCGVLNEWGGGGGGGGGGVLEPRANAAGSAPAAASATGALPAQFSVENIPLVFMRDIIP